MTRVRWHVPPWFGVIAAGLLAAGCAHLGPIEQTEQVVSFASTDQDVTGGSPTKLTGLLARPAGDGPFAAVVLLHGCNGLRESDGTEVKHYYSWARHLRDRGFLTLLVDSYGPRGLRSLCPLPERDRPIKTDRERVRDAYGALVYLQSQQDVLPQSIGVLGWSNGGQVVIWTTANSNPARPAKLPHGDFRAALAFYPGGCRQAQQSQWKTTIPLLMLIGEADNFTGAKPCVDLVASAKASGVPVDISLYPGAHHAFDAPDLPVRVVKEIVFPDGRSPTIGTAPEARADTLERVPNYFRNRFAR